MTLSGNYTALVTPFKRNLDIDYINLARLCDYQLSNMTQGIVALGSTAEATALDVYEKHKVMETITSSMSGKIPVIAGVNSFTLADALYQSSARFLDGADALLISPPPYIKPTQKGLINFFETIADHSYIPIILYNIPSRTGTTIDLSLIERLSKHPNIIGMKDASGDISYTQKVVFNSLNQNFSVLAGNDNQLLPCLSVGGKGIISVAGNIMASTLTDIINLYSSSETEKAKQLYYNILEIIDILSIETNPIPIKYLMSQIGIIKPYYREPLCLPNCKNKCKLKNIALKLKETFIT